MSADVTILIPAYAAESFIDQTLCFARGQTHLDVEIMVSVDLHADATFERVEEHARCDGRVNVFRQPQRLGWAGNVNFLLDRVQTPYCFIYFHDDVIAPQYVERLLPRLAAAPSAALVHCDVRYIGGTEALLQARANTRSREQRLLQFMLAPDRGAPLRGIMRRDVMGDVRLPNETTNALYANEIFLLEAASRGEFLAHNEVLYLNLINRPEGLMAQWRSVSVDELEAGVRSTIANAMKVLEAEISEETYAAACFACFLWLKRLLDEAEKRAGRRLYQYPHELHANFRAENWPIGLGHLAGDLALWARERWTPVARDLAARL